MHTFSWQNKTQAQMDCLKHWREKISEKNFFSFLGKFKVHVCKQLTQRRSLQKPNSLNSLFFCTHILTFCLNSVIVHFLLQICKAAYFFPLNSFVFEDVYQNAKQFLGISLPKMQNICLVLHLGDSTKFVNMYYVVKLVDVVRWYILSSSSCSSSLSISLWCCFSL